MLRTRGTTRSASPSRTLPRELKVVDRLLEDERFFAPFIAWSRTPMGRPSIPVEQYLRLMFLKRRYGLSYESVVRMVSDNVAWRTFCRIPRTPPCRTTRPWFAGPRDMARTRCSGSTRSC